MLQKSKTNILWVIFNLNNNMQKVLLIQQKFGTGAVKNENTAKLTLKKIDEQWRLRKGTGFRMNHGNKPVTRECERLCTYLPLFLFSSTEEGKT